MATADEYAAWIVKNADKRGTPEFETVAQAYKLARTTPAASDVKAAAPGAKTAQDSKLEDAPGNGVSLAAGLGTGFGKAALGAQRFFAKSLEAMDDIMPGKIQPTLADQIAGRKPRNTLARIANWLRDDADTGKARLDKELEPYKAAHPITTGAGEVGGGIVATLPVGGLLPKVAEGVAGAKGVLGVLPRMGSAAKAGAVYGAVNGATASNADTLGGMMADGGRGALTGAAAGATLVPVGAAVGAVGGNVAQRLSKTSAAEYAKQKIAEAFARDAVGEHFTSGVGNPLTQAAARFSGLGPGAVMADAGGRNTNQLLDTLATLPGRTKDAAYNVLRQRTAGVGDRMRSAAEDALGTQGQRLPTTVESLILRRQTDSAPLYAQLRQTSIQPTKNLTDIVAAADELGATKLGREIATARQLPFTLDSTKPDKWQMSDLDHVKQGIDQVLSSRKAVNADGTFTPLGNAYQSLKTRLVDALDAATTNKQTGESLYRNARTAFSEPSKLIDAANAGKLAISRDEASITASMKDMTGNELQAFRIGAFEGLRNKLGTQGGQTDIMNMWKNQSTQEKLKAVFGDLRSYREFAASVAKEAQLKRLQSVGAGPQTAARTAGMGDLDLPALTEAAGAVGALKAGNPLSALGSAKNAWNRVATPQTVRDQMGSMLLSKGAGAEREMNSLTALVQGINQRNLLLSNNVGVLGGQVGARLAVPAPQR